VDEPDTVELQDAKLNSLTLNMCDGSSAEVYQRVSLSVTRDVRGAGVKEEIYDAQMSP